MVLTMLASLAMLAVTKVPAVDRRIMLAAMPRALRSKTVGRAKNGNNGG